MLTYLCPRGYNVVAKPGMVVLSECRCWFRFFAPDAACWAYHGSRSSTRSPCRVPGFTHPTTCAPPARCLSTKDTPGNRYRRRPVDRSCTCWGLPGSVLRTECGIQQRTRTTTGRGRAMVRTLSYPRFGRPITQSGYTLESMGSW